MNTERTRQERLQKWINLKEEERKQRLAKRDGISIGKAVGSSLMNPTGSAAPNDSPDGEAQAQDGDKNKLTAKLELGDELEDFELYDCETGEKVTLDGFGGNSAEPKYPIGFEDCKAEKKPTMEELDGKTIFIAELWSTGNFPEFQPKKTYSLSSSSFYSLVSEGQARVQAESRGGCSPTMSGIRDDLTSGSWLGTPYFYAYYNGSYQCFADIHKALSASYRTSTSTTDKQAYIDNFEAPIWDENDKNHLTLNDDGCFGTLCPEHNTQVSPKYQGCQDEMILCDENGKKNKVTVNADGSVDILQGDFNQVSTVKNGKVVSVKKLTESQKERAMNAS